MKELKQSETVVVKRSEILENPFNPKSHTKEQIEQQKKNFKKVGYLGGVVWNSVSGHLIDGHRRLKASDAYYGYDGTPETDYELKVEKVEFDDKTEKEQMTYQAIGNTKADYNLIAKYVHDISPENVGISEADFEQIKLLADDIEEMGDIGNIEDFSNDFLNPMPDIKPVVDLPRNEKTNDEIVQEHAEKPKMTAEEVKEQKAHQKDVAERRQEEIDLYAFVTFSNLEEKQIFADLIGAEMKNSMRVSGEDILKLVD